MANEGSSVFRLSSTFELPIIFSSLLVNVADEPVKLSFFRVKIPVTTTSSISATSVTKVIFNSFSPFHLTAFFSIPINEYTNVNSFISGTDKTYFPSVSVTVPSEVPWICTVTPGSKLPFSSVTLPTIFTSWVCFCGTLFCSRIITRSSSIRKTKGLPFKQSSKTSSRPTPFKSTETGWNCFTASLSYTNLYSLTCLKYWNTSAKEAFFIEMSNFFCCE